MGGGGVSKSKAPTAQEAQAEARFLEEYVKELWTFLPLPVCYVNPVHKILNINTALLDLSGYAYDEGIGMAAKKLFTGAGAEQFFKDVLEKESADRSELELVRKDGRRVPVHAYSRRRAEDGKPIGYFLGIVDISSEKRFRENLEEMVREKTMELNEKVEELERFRRLSVGRELKMIELKREIEDLQKHHGARN